MATTTPARRTRRKPTWTPAWFRRQLRAPRGYAAGSVIRHPLLFLPAAVFLYGFWAGWAALVAMTLVGWWMIVACGWLYWGLGLGILEAGYWGAGKVADRVG